MRIQLTEEQRACRCGACCVNVTTLCALALMPLRACAARVIGYLRRTSFGGREWRRDRPAINGALTHCHLEETRPGRAHALPLFLCFPRLPTAPRQPMWLGRNP